MFRIFIILLLMPFGVSSQIKTDTELLKKAYLNKDESIFLEQFPKTFEPFKATFGWDDTANGPTPLYENANSYIDYFFKLVTRPKFSSYKNTIINIAVTAIWEADGVNYFHKHLHDLVETDKSFVLLLKELDKKQISSFWRFYFDLEQLTYSPKLTAILDESMRKESLAFFNALQNECKNESVSDHVPITFKVFDKDGYTNLRREKNTSSEIIERLKSGNHISVLDKTGSWWYIETINKKLGFIHKSRIVLANPQ
jgi:hypothetical protein